jgi:HD-like signal output (HDOD) protein
MSTENALLTILTEKINNDTLILPTLPAIALKVRKAADDPNVNLVQMGEVISQDPSLSARMIKIANSAYLGRTVKVQSLGQAVTRIGLRQIKNIATALAMEQLFVSQDETVKKYLNQVWENTVEVVSSTLAALEVSTQQTKQRHLIVDTMLLSALIHNIGVLPILTEAERHKEIFANPSFLDIAIDKVGGKIGAVIMDQWGFGDEFIQIAQSWADLEIQTENTSYLDFVRLGAAISGNFDSQKDAVLNISLRKGVVSEIGMLQDEEFNELKTAAKSLFA